LNRSFCLEVMAYIGIHVPSDFLIIWYFLSSPREVAVVTEDEERIVSLQNHLYDSQMASATKVTNAFPS